MGGIKYDKDKIRMELIPPKALVAIGEIMTMGAKKYGANNWQGVSIDRYVGALIRHLVKYMENKDSKDPDSELSHMKHVLTNAAFIVALEDKELNNTNKKIGFENLKLEDLSHPGETLQELMCEKNIKHIPDLSKEELDVIINNKSLINKDLSKKLGKFLGVSDEFFYNLQKLYLEDYLTIQLKKQRD